MSNQPNRAVLVAVITLDAAELGPGVGLTLGVGSIGDTVPCELLPSPVAMHIATIDEDTAAAIHDATAAGAADAITPARRESLAQVADLFTIHREK